MGLVLAAAGVLAPTPNFHHVGFFGLFAVFATVFAVFLRWTIACAMGALCGGFFSHYSTSRVIQLCGGITKVS